MTAALLLAATGISYGQEQPQGKVLRIGFSFPFYFEHPAQDEEPLAFEHLTDLPLGAYSDIAVGDWLANGEPLYSDYQQVFPTFSFVQEREGGKTFYAELKPNIFFHDGSIATLDDVEFSLNRDVERYPASKQIVFTKLSPRRFTLSSDRPEFWMKFLHTPLKKRVGDGGKSISAGPYIITAVDRKKRRVRLKAFDKYVNGPPLAAEIEYTFYNNSEMAMFGFLAGETDFMCGLSWGQEKVIGKIPGIRIVGYASQDNYMLAFNTAKPPMDDILVRKAISLLIDRYGLIAKSDYLRGGAIPTKYQFAVSAPATKPQADPPAPAEAFKLLQKAGYARTAKGWEKDGKPIRIFMQIPSRYLANIPEARIICRWLDEAGLDTNLELTPTDNYYNPKVLDKFHILFFSAYDRFDFEHNYAQFRLGDRSNLFQSTDPAPAILLAGAKSGSLTANAKEAIVRKIADYSYSAPLFYPVDYCAGKDDTEYGNAFFMSPTLYSVINRNAPSGPLRSQTGLETNRR